MDKLPRWDMYRNYYVSIWHVLPGTHVRVKYNAFGVWDGQKIVVTGEQAENVTSFLTNELDEYGAIEVHITPTENTSVVVLDDDEVQRLFEGGYYE